MGAANAHYLGIKVFSETDFTDDLKAIDVPTLVMHGDDDQIVPYKDAGLLSVKLSWGRRRGCKRNGRLAICCDQWCCRCWRADREFATRSSGICRSGRISVSDFNAGPPINPNNGDDP